MSSIVLSRVLTGQHRQLDRLLEDADKLCGTAFEPEALSRFCDAMERHLGVEERVLFPALEQRMGRGGPITVMRQEHDAIRGLMAALRVAEAPGAYGPIVETLTVLVQQHHVKEEHVLYPLSDELLADCAQTLAEALETEEARTSERFLDVSQLAPPEPLESAMRAILALRPGERLRLRVPREPYPLYGLMSEHGFRYESRPVSLGDETLCELVITRP